MISFNELMYKHRGGRFKPPNVLLAIDPGESTGWAVFTLGELTDKGQLNKLEDTTAEQMVSDSCDKLVRLCRQYKPDAMVVEDYRVYGSKTQMHAGNALITPKLIGALHLIASLEGAKISMQMASSKQFCTDEKLKAWGYYSKGKPHANDAVRHGCYWLLFNKNKGGKPNAK